MAEDFVSFASLLTVQPREEVPTPPPISRPPVDAPPARAASPQLVALLASFASEIVRLRARATEIVENEAEALLQQIAARVLVRELELAPADIAALCASVRDEWREAHPIRFRVAAEDMPRLTSLGELLEPDPSLPPGDLVVDLADGTLDLRLGTRLAAIIDDHSVAL